MYLFHLHDFLQHAAQHSPNVARSLKEHSEDDHTEQLADMVKALQTEYKPYFIFGAGSNEYNQLLLDSIGVDEVHELTEMLLVVPRQSNNNENENEGSDSTVPNSLHAGGGHSGLLTNGGDLYLWGCNWAGQLGHRGGTAASKSSSTAETTTTTTTTQASSFNVIPPLSNIKVETVDLGHNHSLIIEKDTGRLFGFGENGRGQVTGCVDNSDDTTSCCHDVPQTPIGLSDECFVDVAAGLFHSAAITKKGELITWGCGRFGQCLTPSENGNGTVRRWQPSDGSKLVQVVCGRRHTIMLDEYGRVWTLGNNKYGQLGQQSSNVDHPTNDDRKPQLVDGPLGQVNSGCFAIYSGWSHTLALCRDNDDKACTTLYGWGRNDKGQLGMKSSSGHVAIPHKLKTEHPIQSACCGAESSHIMDTNGNIYSTGWNEHGNLATGCQAPKEDMSMEWVLTSGVRVVAPPPSSGNAKKEKKQLLFAAGGAHFITVAI